MTASNVRMNNNIQTLDGCIFMSVSKSSVSQIGVMAPPRDELKEPIGNSGKIKQPLLSLC